jgi:hypothetical protein
MKGLAVVLIIVLGYCGYAYFRGQWPFRNRAIMDCARTGDMMTCLEMKYGWSRPEAGSEALGWRVRNQ